MIAIVVAALTSHDAHANGRFPTAQFFALGEGAASDRIALSTTYGLVVSLDGGERWRWICEDALGISGEYDPITSITDSGALIVTRPDGAAISRGDWCDFSTITEVGTDPAIDATTRGSTSVLSTQLATGGARMFFSDDALSWTSRWSSSMFFVQTVDVSPTAPSRVFATAQDRAGYPWILRSDDRGASFDTTTATPLAGVLSTFLAAIDDADDQRLLLRSYATDGSGVLSRSDDGGRTLRTVRTSVGAFVAAAAAPGFARIWASSNEAGARLQRSDDGGSAWRTTSTTVRPRSLRFRREILYAALSEQQAGFSFGCSIDGGESFRRLLSVDDISGPEACASATSVRTRCEGQWPTVRAQLLALARPPTPARGRCDPPTPQDSGLDAESDASPDATLDAAPDANAPRDDARASDVSMDSDGADASASVDAEAAPSVERETGRYTLRGGCLCSVNTGSTSRPRNALVAWLAMGVFAALRRRKSSYSCSSSRGLR